MKKNNIRDWILVNCFSTKGLNNRTQLLSWWKNKHFQEQYELLLDQTSYLDTNNISQRIYHILNENVRTTCKTCNASVEFMQFKSGYREYCSSSCVYKSKIRNQKIGVKSKINGKIQASNYFSNNGNYYFQTEEFKRKAKHTKLIRHGNENYNNSERLKKHIDIDLVVDRHFKDGVTYTELANELGLSEPAISKKMREAGYSGIKHNVTSSYERMLMKEYAEFNPIQSDRLKIGKELDVYFPNHNLAIEINGTYWHNDQRRDKSHLLEKLILCNKNNIELLHFWDYEIVNKLEIVKSIISNKLKKINSIYARKTKIVQLSPDTYRTFLNKNHLQGAINSPIKLGLEHNNNLVAVMGFGNSRFKKNEIELHRYCNLINMNVVGGASKLFQHFIRTHKPNSIISYCDKRIFSGKMYENIGMQHIKDTPLNYWYCRGNTMYSRMKFQKHRLNKLLSNFDPTLTEYENMINNRFYRVWDCGNKLYEWRNDVN